MTPLPPEGLYAITDVVRGQTADDIVAAVAQAIAGGAAVIQYRDKVSGEGAREQIAGALLETCRAASLPLIINDDVALACRIGADGVHVGKEDSSVAAARSALGGAAIIGVSCYNDIERALAASRAGASYIAFGRFFASRTKPHAVQADLGLLRRARAELALPIVAIGGITADNAHLVIEAGAHFVAVIDGIFAQPDIAAAARRFRRVFERIRTMPAVAQ